jgi:competence protein ComEC
MFENRIAGEVGRIDVLKVPHHGSKTGMSDYFLETTMPKLVLISAGRKNRYGHPAKESLDLLSNFNVKVFRTDINGETEVISDGKSYWVKN